MVESLKAEHTAGALIDELSQKKFTLKDIEKMLLELRGDEAGRRSFHAIIEALTELGRPAIPSLVRVLKNENKGMRRAAAEALDRIGWLPDEGEAGAAYWVAKRKWNQCVAIGAPAVLPLVNALKDENSSVRWDAAETLGKIGDARAVPLLNDALKDENSSVRRAVIEALGKLGAPAVLPLIGALENGDDDARWTATRMLGKIRDARAVPPLIDALQYDGARRAAAKALDEIGWKPDSDEVGAVYWIAKRKWDRCVAMGAPAVLPLIDTLKNGDDEERCAAAGTLGRIGDTRAVPSLIDALKDEDHNVRRAAAEALGKLGDARAVPPLKEAFLDRNYRVHRAIGKAIKRFEKP